MASDIIVSAKKVVTIPLGVLDNLGEQMSFYIRAIAWTPRTITRYKKESAIKSAPVAQPAASRIVRLPGAA